MRVTIRYWAAGPVMIIALLLFFQNTRAQSFTLRGTIKGKNAGFAVLRYFRDHLEQRKSDTVAIKNGMFNISGEINAVDFALLDIYPVKSEGMRYSTALFIEPGIITITFKEGGPGKPVISGSRTQREYDALKKYTSKEDLELNRLSKSYASIIQLLKDGVIDSKMAEKRKKDIDKLTSPIQKVKNEKELAYIRKHAQSYVSLLLLYTFVGRIPNDSIDILYIALSSKVKGSTLDYSFLQYNAKYRTASATAFPFDKLEINTKAPLFNINNTLTGSNMTVEDFKGKVLVLEFWGLYCFPCLKVNPELESIRKKYGKENLEIIAISSNGLHEMPQVISYIKKNNFLEWIHVSTDIKTTTTENLIFNGDFHHYSALAVPRTIVIDKSGQVIYKNNGYSSDELQNLKLVIAQAINKE